MGQRQRKPEGGVGRVVNKSQLSCIKVMKGKILLHKYLIFSVFFRNRSILPAFAQSVKLFGSNFLENKNRNQK